MPDAEIAQQRRMRVRVIALIVVALAILGFLIFLLTGGGGELFQSKAVVRTYMSDATGLNKNAPVRLNGILIGKIRSVGLSGSMDPHRVIQIEMAIKGRFLSALPIDSVAAISADNLLGDKYINITEGKKSERVSAGGELPSLIQTDTFNQADLVASLRTNLQRLDDLLTQVESPKTQLGQFVQGEEFYARLRDQIQNIQEAVTKYGSPRSEFGKSLYREELYRKLRAPIVDFDKMLAELQRGEGRGGQWLTSSAFYDDAVKNVADLRHSLEDLNAGKGQFGGLLTDDEMYNKIRKLLTSMEKMIDELNSGQGQLGRLLSSAQLYESLNGSTRELRELLGQVRANPQKFLRIRVF